MGASVHPRARVRMHLYAFMHVCVRVCHLLYCPSTKTLNAKVSFRFFPKSKIILHPIKKISKSHPKIIADR